MPNTQRNVTVVRAPPIVGPTEKPTEYRSTIIAACQLFSSSERESAIITRTTVRRPAAPIPAIPRPASIMGMFLAPVDSALPSMKNTTDDCMAQ